MIEIIYDETEHGKEAPEIPIRLPKNLRQIGDDIGDTKIYIEDYVITFIRKFWDKGDEVTAGVLLGEVKRSGKETYIFVPGAISIDPENIKLENGRLLFTDETWGSIYSTIKEFFNKYMIVGWFVNRNENCHEVGQELLKTHIDNFPGADKILFLSDVSENEEKIYRYENGAMVDFLAYYVYYERNEDMQEYMVSGKNNEISSPIEIEVKDAVPTSYRNILKEKKEESSQKRIVGALYGACTFLAFVILMIGVAMMNNYDKIESLEKLVSDLYKTAMGQVRQDNTNINDKQNLPVIDKVAGNVEPTSSFTQKAEPESTPAGTEILDGSKDVMQGEVIDNKKPEPESTQEEPESTQAEPESTKAEPESTPAESESTKESTGNEEKVTDVVAKEGIKYHIVVEGDTLTAISRKFYNTDTMVDEIMKLNEIDNKDMIYPGQVINLP